MDIKTVTQPGFLASKPFIGSCSSIILRRHSLHACRASLRKNQEFLDALFSAARQEALPWLQDLVFPVLGVSDDVENTSGTQPTLPPTALAEPDSQFVALPTTGVRMHYKEHLPSNYNSNTSTAPTIILIHGFNGSTFSWRANAQFIASATGSRVLSFDRPPFGLSERPLKWGSDDQGQMLSFNPYELEGSMKLTEEFLDAVGVTGPFVAVGHSAGALVALELARRRPRQINSLVLVAPAVPTNSENSLLRRTTFGSQLRFLATRVILQSDTAGLRYVRRQLMKQQKTVEKGDLGFTPHPATASSVSSLSSMASVDLNSEGAEQSTPFERSDGDDPGSVMAVGDGNLEWRPDGVDAEAWWEAAAEEAVREAALGYTKPLRAQDWDRAALLNLRAFTLPPVFDYSCTDPLPVLVVQGDQDGALTLNARALVELLQDRRRENGVGNGNGSFSSPSVVFKEMKCAHVPMEELPGEFNATVVDFLKTQSNLKT